MRSSARLLIFLVTACASVSSDDRVSVDASLVAESAEASLYRVVVRNTSERVLTIERVEVQPTRGENVRGASVNPRQILSPGEAESYNISGEIEPRDLRRTVEEIGGPKVVSRTRTALGKPTARVYVTFLDGKQRVTASYKVDL